MASVEHADRDEVVTEALRGLRRSALRCRRARLLLEAGDEHAPDAPVRC